MNSLTIRCTAFAEHAGIAPIPAGQLWQAGCGECWLLDPPPGHWHGDTWVPETAACPFVGCVPATLGEARLG